MGTTTKKEECEHESSLLRQERIKIKAIIGELDMLKIAGGGLNKEDAGKTITEDIQYLESKIEEETVSSEKDWKTCLSNSENDEAKEMKSANGAYSDAEKKLVATNVKEEAKYGRTLKSKTKQSKQRLAASQGTLNEAVSRHNDASNKNKKAQQKLKIAQEFQFDEVATSKTIRITELKRAADKKARYIADKNEEAKETRDDAQETFDAHTTSKNEECSTERGILKEEKDTLKLTSMKIGKLQVVDNTAADNKAAAEKAAADKAAAEKAAAKKAAADKYTIKNEIDKIGKVIGKTAKKIGREVTKGAKKIGKGAKKATKKIGKGIKKIGKGAKKATKKIGNGIKKLFGGGRRRRRRRRRFKWRL